MERKLAGLVVLSLLILCIPLLAHHGGAVEYNMDKTIGPINGTVTKFAFSYPHPQVYFDVKTDKGDVQHWGVLLRPTPLMLRNAGWTRGPRHVGHRIPVHGRRSLHSPGPEGVSRRRHPNAGSKEIFG